MSETLCDLGIFGLTSIGQSLAAHHASTKARVCVGDEDANFVPQVINEYKAQMELGEHEHEPRDSRASRCMLPSNSMVEMVARLSQPRKIIIFGTHGEDAKFEAIWNKLASVLEEHDAVLRWGKEVDDGPIKNIQFYSDSIVGNLSRTQAKPNGIYLMEMVRVERDRMAIYEGDNPEVFMVGGGSAECYNQLEPFISPFGSMGHVGDDAGCVHYAQMIQRAIENGVTQALAEGTDILRNAGGYENQDIGRIMNKWQEADGKLSSYLLRISSKIYYKRDNISKKGFVIDHIADVVDFNAADTWLTLEATKLGIPAPTINATLESRFLSNMKDERVEASTILKVPQDTDTPSVLKDQIVEDIQLAIYCACVCIVAECLSIFQAASEVEGWDINFDECVRLWNLPGSFLESTLLERMYTPLADNKEEMRNLLTLPEIAVELQELHISWRRIVTLSFASAIPCPTMSSSLTYYDSYRSRKMPIGLVRAQRDFFDASGYDRNKEEGWYSTSWTKEHTLQKRRIEAALEAGRDVEPPVRRKKKKST